MATYVTQCSALPAEQPIAINAIDATTNELVSGDDPTALAGKGAYLIVISDENGWLHVDRDSSIKAASKKTHRILANQSHSFGGISGGLGIYYVSFFVDA